MFTVAVTAEKMNKQQLPLWIVFVAFDKAFDAVDHQLSWTALREQGVPEVYVQVLIKLYRQQVGSCR